MSEEEVGYVTEFEKDSRGLIPLKPIEFWQTYKPVEQHICIMYRSMNVHEVSFAVVCNIKERRKYVNEFT